MIFKTLTGKPITPRSPLTNEQTVVKYLDALPDGIIVEGSEVLQRELHLGRPFLGTRNAFPSLVERSIDQGRYTLWGSKKTITALRKQASHE